MRTMLPIFMLLTLTGCPAGQPADAPNPAAPKNITAVSPSQTDKVSNAPQTPSGNLSLTTTTFKVAGMDCADCSKAIQGKLIGMPGVSTVAANEKDGTAVVQYDPGKISKQEIIDAIAQLKYTATEVKP